MELDYQEIGRNIRRYRQKKGLNQKELAELIHLMDQHVSHIENAHTKLSLPTLVAIANVLEIDCNSLLGETLTGGRGEVLHQRLADGMNKLDTVKLGLLAEFCDVLAEYDLNQTQDLN